MQLSCVRLEKRRMTTPCTLTIGRTETGYRFSVIGRGTMKQSPAVRDFVCGALEDGADVVLDLSACQYLDSTFLGCLVLLHQRGKKCDGCFSILADDATRSRLLKPVHLERLLDFAESTPETSGEPVTLQVTELEREEFCRHLMETHRQLANLGGPAAATFQRIAEQLAAEYGK